MLSHAIPEPSRALMVLLTVWIIGTSCASARSIPQAVLGLIDESLTSDGHPAPPGGQRTAAGLATSTTGSPNGPGGPGGVNGSDFAKPERDWECDVRVWVRAPDLAPGSVVPGDVRMAANGSACGDIEEWSVGLRMRERAVVKKIAKDAKIPLRPVRKNRPWEMQRGLERQYDRNDILSPETYMSWKRNHAVDPFEAEMETYKTAIRNASLWEIHAQERVVFDIHQELSLPHSNSQDMEIIQPFEVHMPWTNLPPQEEHPVARALHGENEQLVTSETQMQYYVSLLLKNGTNIEIPAGRAGFSSMPTLSTRNAPAAPGYRRAVDESQGEALRVELVSSRRTKQDANSEDHDEFFDYGQRDRSGPECDKNNLAAFTIDIKPSVSRPVQGTNITLDVTLTRSGNGSEYPSFLDIWIGSADNITWAYNFAGSESEYKALTVSGKERRRSHGSFGSDHRPRVRVLRISSQEKLERRRAMEEDQAKGGVMTMGSHSMRRWPAGKYVSRWDPEENEEDVSEKNEIKMELAVPLTAYPYFEKTFETAQSLLRVNLQTMFLCEMEDAEGEPTLPPQLSPSDPDWTEWRLPLRRDKTKRKYKRKATHWSSPISHTGAVPIEVVSAKIPPQEGVRVLSGQTAQKDVEALRHYLDPRALGPVMVLPEAGAAGRAVDFPLLDQTLRDEPAESIRKTRYGSDDMYMSRGFWCARHGNGRDCWHMNSGGGRLHAAKLWQRKVAIEARTSVPDGENAAR